MLLATYYYRNKKYRVRNIMIRVTGKPIWSILSHLICQTSPKITTLKIGNNMCAVLFFLIYVLIYF
jgi:hypothetical protein